MFPVHGPRLDCGNSPPRRPVGPGPGPIPRVTLGGLASWKRQDCGQGWERPQGGEVVALPPHHLTTGLSGSCRSAAFVTSGAEPCR